MAAKILQINFKIEISGAAVEQAVAPVTRSITHSPGLRWKIWVLNEAEHEAMAIYLFDDGGSLQAFLAGPIAARLAADLGASEVSVKTFDTVGALTPILRGPIRAIAPASP